MRSSGFDAPYGLQRELTVFPAREANVELWNANMKLRRAKRIFSLHWKCYQEASLCTELSRIASGVRSRPKKDNEWKSYGITRLHRINGGCVLRSEI